MNKIKLIGLLLFWLLNLSSQNNWRQLGITSANYPDVKVMFKDTITNVLYAGGMFTDFGGVTTKGIAQWNGVKWDSVGGGIDRNTANTAVYVKKIIKYKNYIYAFGYFTQAGHLACRNMARWNGSQWDTLIGGTDGPVIDADVYNDTLYVCGDFTSIGTINSNFAAKFDGTTWHPISFPFNDQGPMYNIRVFKNKIYGIGAWYSSGFGLTAEYTPQTGWQPSLGIQGSGTKGVWGIERIDSLLYFYGRFTHLSTMHSPDIAAWSGTKLYGFGAGINPAPTNAFINKVKKIHNKIYCVGQFDNAHGLSNGNNNLGIASLSGNQWCIYGDDFNNVVADLDTYNDTLIIAGGYQTINTISNIAVSKWVGGAYTYSCSSFYTVLKENSLSGRIKIYPNPTTAILNIEDEQNELQNATIEITNSIGQIILQLPFSETIDVSRLSPGCYFMSISTGKKHVLHNKFLKE